MDAAGNPINGSKSMKGSGANWDVTLNAVTNKLPPSVYAIYARAKNGAGLSMNSTTARFIVNACQ
jgi:hypothetical protein